MGWVNTYKTHGIGDFVWDGPWVIPYDPIRIGPGGTPVVFVVF